MSIRRPASSQQPSHSIHPAADEAWKKLIAHPSSALLTHVPRPGIRMNPSDSLPKKSRMEGQDSKPTVADIAPMILAFFKSGGFASLCKNVTMLLSTSKMSLEDDVVWSQITNLLRMPFPLYEPRLINFHNHRHAFQFYCKGLTSEETRFSTKYIMQQWQNRILHIMETNDRRYDAFPDALRNAVSSWVWVIDNYPVRIERRTMNEFIDNVAHAASDSQWEMFNKILWSELKDESRDITTSMVKAVINSPRGYITGNNRTIDFMIRHVDPPRIGIFVNSVFRAKSYLEMERPSMDRTRTMKTEIVDFYGTNLLPAMTRILNYNGPDEYQVAVNSVAEVFSAFIDSWKELLRRETRAYDIQVFFIKLANFTIYNARTFFTHGLPKPVELIPGVLGYDFENLDRVKSNIDEVMNPNVVDLNADDERYPWPKSLISQSDYRHYSQMSGFVL